MRKPLRTEPHGLFVFAGSGLPVAFRPGDRGSRLRGMHRAASQPAGEALNPARGTAPA